MASPRKVYPEHIQARIEWLRKAGVSDKKINLNRLDREMSEEAFKVTVHQVLKAKSCA